VTSIEAKCVNAGLILFVCVLCLFAGTFITEFVQPLKGKPEDYDIDAKTVR
jgi:hypothetical protein